MLAFVGNVYGLDVVSSYLNIQIIFPKLLGLLANVRLRGRNTWAGHSPVPAQSFPNMERTLDYCLQFLSKALKVKYCKMSKFLVIKLELLLD